MKVSIIGSNGFLSDRIGKYCISKSYCLNVLGQQAPELFNPDSFTKIDLLGKVDFSSVLNSDVIFYAAGAGIQANKKDSMSLIFDLNVRVPVLLADFLKSNNFKGYLITFGSYFEIGSTSENRPMNESDVIFSSNEIPSEYCLSKRMLSRFFSSFQSEYSFYHFILPTIYGEGEASHRLIPYLISCIQDKKELQLTSGAQVRQYLYVEDAVSLAFKSVEKSIPSGIYNMAGTETLSVREIVELLFQSFEEFVPDNIFGKESRVDERMKSLILDGSKLQEVLNFKPSMKLVNVIERY